MKSFFKTLLTMGSIFGIIMGMLACGFISIFSGINHGLSSGLVVTLGSGLLFGLFMAFFTASQRKIFEKQRLEFQGEKLLHDGPANHFVNRESVGGWLFLTDKRLLFRSHKFNVQSQEWSLPLSDIGNTQIVLTAGIVPNGLRVSSVTGQIDNFVVEGNRRWREQVLSAKTQMA